MIARFIRRCLGLDQIQDQLDYQNRRLNAMQTLLANISKQTSLTTPALGRIIAKLDPAYATESTPEHRAESDRLGVEVERRLRAEHLARQHQEGKA